MALDCATCGACCLIGGGLPIEEAEREGNPLSKKLIDEATELCETCPVEEIPWCVWFIPSKESVDGGPCGKCKHYDLRPNVCRDFTKGSNSCLAAIEIKNSLLP